MIINECLIMLKYRIYEIYSIRFQYWCWKRDIHWHNWIRDECTPDFSCCMIRHSFIKQVFIKLKKWLNL